MKVFHQRQLGFTLLEILLVTVLFACVAVLVVLTLPRSSEYVLRRTTEKLAIQIDELSDNALIHGDTYGLLITDKSYTFLRLTANNKWESMNYAVTLPDGIHLNLIQIEDFVFKTDPDIQTPQIWFWSDGTLTPFELQVGSVSSRYRLSVNLLGQSNIQMVEETL